MDPFQEKISDAVQNEAQRGLLRGFRRVARTCYHVASRRSIAVPALWAEDAEVYLRECLERCAGEATRSAGPWSHYEWLFYLRRIDNRPFAGSLASTAPYDRSLTEILAGLGAAAMPSQGFRDGTFPFSVRHARYLADAIGLAAAVSQLHVCYRFAGKGAAVRLDRRIPRVSHPFPIAERGVELDRATLAYDRRVVSGLGHGSLGFLQLPDPTEEPDPHRSFFTVHLLDDFARLPFPPQDPTGEISARFSPSLMDMSGLRAVAAPGLLEDPTAWHDELPCLAALLAIGMFLTSVGGEGQQGNLLRCGYIVVDTRIIDDVWRRFRGPAADSVEESLGRPFAESIRAIDDLLVEVRRVRGVPWPRSPGPVVFAAADDMTGIDLWAATNRFMTLLEYPRDQGEAANVRARIFERQVQAMLDESAWRPTEDLARLRGVHLRLNGNQIGEIDAIGRKDGELFIVSCKSAAYTRDYDVGRYNVVRNTRTMIEDAVTAVDDLVELLRQNPVGDNYDLASIRSFVSVVATSRACFVEEPLLSREALPGLRKYSTILEFAEWLIGEQSDDSGAA